MSAIARSRRTESWQVRWGLPRPSLVGLMAGTCIVFKIKDEKKVSVDRLAEIEISGIGERTAEGYGQICFNDRLLTESAVNKSQDKENDSQSNYNNLSKLVILKKDKNFENNNFDYARIIEHSAWQDAIQKAALFLAKTEDSRYRILGIKLETEEGKQQKKSKPSMSQLGSLRSALSNLKSPDDAGVTSWLKSLKENRGDKWDKGNNTDKASLEKISELITKTNKVWEYLDEALEELKHPKLAELVITEKGEDFHKSDLWAITIKILVDACIRAHKREWEESTNQGAE